MQKYPFLKWKVKSHVSTSGWNCSAGELKLRTTKMQSTYGAQDGLAVYAYTMISVDNASLILGAFLLLREAAGAVTACLQKAKRLSLQSPSLPAAHLTSSVISHFPVFHHEQRKGL